MISVAVRGGVHVRIDEKKNNYAQIINYPYSMAWVWDLFLKLV